MKSNEIAPAARGRRLGSAGAWLLVTICVALCAGPPTSAWAWQDSDDRGRNEKSKKEDNRNRRDDNGDRYRRGDDRDGSRPGEAGEKFASGKKERGIMDWLKDKFSGKQDAEDNASKMGNRPREVGSPPPAGPLDGLSAQNDPRLLYPSPRFVDYGQITIDQVSNVDYLRTLVDFRRVYRNDPANRDGLGGWERSRPSGYYLSIPPSERMIDAYLRVVQRDPSLTPDEQVAYTANFRSMITANEQVRYAQRYFRDAISVARAGRIDAAPRQPFVNSRAMVPMGGFNPLSDAQFSPRRAGPQQPAPFYPQQYFGPAIPVGQRPQSPLMSPRSPPPGQSPPPNANRIAGPQLPRRAGPPPPSSAVVSRSPAAASDNYANEDGIVYSKLPGDSTDKSNR